MNAVEAKAYVNKRYAELSEDRNNVFWSRCGKVNLILSELRKEHNFVLTTPTGHPIVSVYEDDIGLVFDVTGLMR